MTRRQSWSQRFSRTVVARSPNRATARPSRSSVPRRRTRLRLEALEDRTLLSKNIVIDAVAGALPQFSFVDPHPTPGGHFGQSVTVLNNGNVVVTNPNDNLGGTNAGAVYLFDGLTGALLSSLVGSSANDQVGGGGVTALSNGNYVVASPNWNFNYGAVTWGSGTAGVTGAVGADNSLTGSNPNDYVGGSSTAGVGGVIALRNGNYVVASPSWKNGANGNAGAVTWGNGMSGVRGLVSTGNSLTGSNANDYVGGSSTSGVGGVTPVSNGVYVNYAVASPNWRNPATGNASAGAVTWCSGTAVTAAAVATGNSLVGTSANDQVGSGGVTPLSNGNYAVDSPNWGGGVGSNLGAVTWGSGIAVTAAQVGTSNSLVGSGANDQVGSGGITPLVSNGNYVVDSPHWGNRGLLNAGAVTWGNGMGGTTGTIFTTNSLVGASGGDAVGIGGVTPLTNGNYVVLSPNWNTLSGAVTWGSGTAGVSGNPGAGNSLVGSNAYDEVGIRGVTPLSNGNYVVDSIYWGNNTGAATWGSGTTGVSSFITASNSLIGSSTYQFVGDGGITPLANGNYVVNSPDSAVNGGAVTLGSGSAGVHGTVTANNSLVGTDVGPAFVPHFVTPLSNGNYVVLSPSWNGSRGAATLASGTTQAPIGAISTGNSLTGSNPGDFTGVSITGLSDGNYVVRTPNWDGARGAATWASGTSGQTLDGAGVITPQNSVLGAAANAGLGAVMGDPTHQAFVVALASDSGGRVVSGFTDPNQLTFNRGQSQTVTITPALLAAKLNTNIVQLQANNDITINSPITVTVLRSPNNFTLDGGRSILINANANIGTDGGSLTLIANEQLLSGVIDLQRDPGNAVVSMAIGTTLNTGSLSIVLFDGAGKTYRSSGAITLQGVTTNDRFSQGQVVVNNNGPTAGSDVVIASVNSSGSQSYANPNGTTVIPNHGGVNPNSSTVTFYGSVTLGAEASVSGRIDFPSSGTQTLQAGDAASLANLTHSGSGTLRLTSAVTVVGDISNTNRLGTFDVSNQTVTVGGNWSWSAGFLVSAGSDVNFNGGSQQELTSRGQGLHHLTHSGIGTLVLRDSLTLAGNFTNPSGAGSLKATNQMLSVGGNWTWASSAFDASGSIVLFTGAGTQALTSGGQTFQQLAHTGSGTLLLIDPLTVGSPALDGSFSNTAGTLDANGQDVRVYGPVTISGGFYIAAAGAQIFNRDLTISGTATFLGMSGQVVVGRNFTQSGGTMIAPSSSTNLSVGGAFVINGGSFDANGGTVTFTGAGTQSLNSGRQAFARLVHSGSSTLRLVDSDLIVTGDFFHSGGTFDANTQPVTVSGLTTIAGGTRYLGSSGSQYFGGGLSMPDGGSLDGSNLTLGGDVTAGADALGNPATITGNLSLDGASRTFTVSPGMGPVQMLISAVISGSPGAGLIKGGAGWMRLLGNNTYTGTTTIQPGFLIVDGAQGSSNLALSGGVLDGVGTVGAITASGGNLNPGEPGIGFVTVGGIMTATGNVALASAVTFGVTLYATTANTLPEQLNVTGTVNLNSDMGAGAGLGVGLGYAVAVGDSFTILTATGGITGTFAGLPEGAIFTAGDPPGMNFQITYQGAGGTAVVLTRVAGPEPPPGDGLVAAAGSAEHAGGGPFTGTGWGPTTLATPGDPGITAADATGGTTGSAAVTLAPALLGSDVVPFVPGTAAEADGALLSAVDPYAAGASDLFFAAGASNQPSRAALDLLGPADLGQLSAERG